MKKIATIALSLVLSFSLVACGSNDGGDNNTDNSNGGDVSTPAESDDDTNTDNNNDQTGNEANTSGSIDLPDFEQVERADAEIESSGEAEDIALVRLEDFELDFSNGGQVINNTEYVVSEVNFNVSLNGGESDHDIIFDNAVAPGEVIPNILNEDLVSQWLESGEVDPESTELTGMWLKVHTEDGYQEIYDRYDGGDGLSVTEYSKTGVVDTEQVYVTADELDISLSTDGNTVTATVTNNSEYPLSEARVSFTATNLSSPGRNDYQLISINQMTDTDLDLPLLPGQTVSKSYEFDTAYENVELRGYFVTIGNEDNFMFGTTNYDVLLDTYTQTKQ